MLTLFGDSPHSPFRLAELLAKLKAAQPEAGVTSLRSEVVYFIDSEIPLSEAQQVLLEELLSAQSNASLPCEEGIFIIPRLGTISPWSSKATCIAQICGLSPPIRRIERGVFYHLELSNPATLPELAAALHDRMTESVLLNISGAARLFDQASPKTFTQIPILEQGLPVLVEANIRLGLALSPDEMRYLLDSFQALGRNPSDLELMMFAQANSEHCRHKIFNALWIKGGMQEGKPQERSLFDMIRYTYQCHPGGVLSAYRDNGAVLAGGSAHRWLVNPHTRNYYKSLEPCHIVIKVETHNHPTAIAPREGAATGAGGEIRDEGAVGCGAKPKAGLVGFTVSNLRIPNFIQPWEYNPLSKTLTRTEGALSPASGGGELAKAYEGGGKPDYMASALEIMLEAPIGAASFNNEFGRPNLCGYFRSYEQGEYGYHKPIMIAGGLGNVRAEAVQKGLIPAGAKIIVLGGPAMLIGLGGGAASSMASGSSDQNLDFASVQRSNPQLQRCCQEVIDACWSLGEANPIIAIHDVGAGGLANALSELVHDSDKGAVFDLRAIPNAEMGMSPLEIWCNEAQERYVLAVLPEQLQVFEYIAERERCPYAVVGEVDASQNLVLIDPYFNNRPAELPFSVLFGKTPKLVKELLDQSTLPQSRITPQAINLNQAASRVLQLPCVADKSFLITIGDRSVGGMVARDPMVGPWQVPVADVAVTLNSFFEYGGEAMAMGERSPMAIIDPAVSAYLAVGEAITNIAAAFIGDISAIKLSANWMAAEGNSDLYAAVQAVAMELCPALGICIPVGKDSLSMRTVWTENGESHEVRSPLSLIISAFAPVLDVRKTLTPVLTSSRGQAVGRREDTELLFIDISSADLNNLDQALSASALAQVYQQIGNQAPSPFDPKRLKAFFQAIQTLNERNLLLAYHDRSDGGLFVTLCEMAFASHLGLDITLDTFEGDPLAILFHEGLGAVVQIRSEDKLAVRAILKTHELLESTHPIGSLGTDDRIRFTYKGQEILSQDRITWQRLWSATSYRMQSLRDNSECAQQAYDRILDLQDRGLYASPSFDIREDVVAPYINTGLGPRVAILREQGVNGHLEMAAAFHRAGFTSMDVHMSDIMEGRQSLNGFTGLAVCGGFSYGDVLGSGQGWAKSILFNPKVRKQFAAFFERPTTFTLGVCNGCQMLSHLTELIPGSDHWPTFKRNTSEQFEARLVMVKVEDSPSLFFKGMHGSELPVVVSHGEGRALFTADIPNSLVSLRFVDASYPGNPNGSPEGITGLSTTDGRVTILMPHPERVFRSVQCSWHPEDWPEDSPWMRLFYNARVWVG